MTDSVTAVWPCYAIAGTRFVLIDHESLHPFYPVTLKAKALLLHTQSSSSSLSSSSSSGKMSDSSSVRSTSNVPIDGTGTYSSWT